MHAAVIVNTDKFRIDSYGNGTSYRFCNKAEMRDVFFKGDDARQFRMEWQAWENANPNMPFDQIYVALWADYKQFSSPAE